MDPQKRGFGKTICFLSTMGILMYSWCGPMLVLQVLKYTPNQSKGFKV